MADEQEVKSLRESFERPKWVTPAVWILGLTAALIVGMSRNGLGPSYLDQAGKALFWTSGVFVPFLAVNTSEISTSLGKRALFLILLIHLLLIILVYKYLTNWSFLTLAPMCLFELLLFNLLFARVETD